MQNINPNQKFEDMSWMQRVHVIRLLSLFPAITVMVFIRRKLGLRMVRPTWLVIMTLIMLIVPFTFRTAAKPFGFFMAAYALAMLGLGMRHYWQRWEGFCNGESWHTMSPGESYLERIPWPRFLKKFRRVNRWLDPAAVAIVGLIIALVISHGLGIWIIFSAVFFYVYEHDLFHQQLKADMDAQDGLIAARVQAEVVKHFEDGQTTEQKQLSLEETDGIPTGLSFDLQRKIQSKRAIRPISPPDNLAAASTGRI